MKNIQMRMPNVIVQDIPTLCSRKCPYFDDGFCDLFVALDGNPSKLSEDNMYGHLEYERHKRCLKLFTENAKAQFKEDFEDCMDLIEQKNDRTE
jgi:hypothetical protein